MPPAVVQIAKAVAVALLAALASVLVNQSEDNKDK